MLWPLVTKTILFRVAIIFIDYAIVVVLLERPLEAGFITIVRHILHTILYFGHEVLWAHQRLDAFISRISVQGKAATRAVVFRIVSMALDFVLLVLLTGDAKSSGVATVAIGIVHTIFFYAYDRWWDTWHKREVVQVEEVDRNDV